MTLWAIVPAAGNGTRFGSAVPKQYLPIAGQPLLAHTLHALLSHQAIDAAMVVLAANDVHWPGWTDFAGKPLHTCIGGATRAASVLAGLQALPSHIKADDWVLIHDAARPNVSANDLTRLLAVGRSEAEGAILAAPLHDTLKRCTHDGRIDRTEPRTQLWRALTPQLFRRYPLTYALQMALTSGIEITDEAMAMEYQGAHPRLIEGAQSNFKITTPDDWARFEFELSQRSKVRTS